MSIESKKMTHRGRLRILQRQTVSKTAPMPYRGENGPQTMP